MNTGKFLKTMTLALLLAPMVLITAPRADASVLFTFQRLSDSQAILTASGTPDTGFLTGENIGHFSGISFEFIVAGFFGAAVPSGDFVFGSNPLNGYFTDGGQQLANDSAFFFDDTSATGTATLTLQGGIDWAPIGASNRVLSDFVSQSAQAGNSQTNVQIGTWEMIAPITPPIPLPGPLVLMAAPLLALGSVTAFRRRVRMAR